MSTSPQRGRLGTLTRLFGLLRPHMGRWVLATVALGLGGAVNLALPQAVREVIDGVLAAGRTEALVGTLWWAIVGVAVLAMLAFARNYLMTWVGTRVVADLRVRTFAQLLRHPPGFFYEQKSGELISRLTADIETLQRAVGAELSIAMRSLIIVLGGLALMFATSTTLSVVMLALVPAGAFGAVWVGRRIRRRSRQVQDEVAAANAGLKEAIVGVATVQSYGAEAREQERYARHIFGAFELGLKVASVRAGFIAGAIFGGYATVAVILGVGVSLVIDEELTGGGLALMLLYTFMVTGALVSLAEIWGNLQRAIGASVRVFELLSREPSIVSPPTAHVLERPQGELVFEQVSFTYPARPEAAVLHEVSLRISPGEFVALVGPSGAGKSTITLLMQRFYDPCQGQVTFDGHDVRALDLESLRRVFAVVRQEPILFSGSIRDNIVYGDPTASDMRVQKAVDDASLTEFIASLPKGIHTEVGERGVKLSGGQRQRIAIARALLFDPKVLILDEATSHLDTENEQAVQEALNRLMHNRSTFVIAHRLSTVRRADRIIVLNEGRVVEEGTHDSLLVDGTLYSRLAAEQKLSSRH